jgi:hypothetical protein
MKRRGSYLICDDRWPRSHDIEEAGWFSRDVIF